MQKKMTLDLYIKYLAEGFNTSYYQLAIFDHSEDMMRRCSRTLRTDKNLIKDMQDWSSQLDLRFKIMFSPDQVSLEDHGGKNYKAFVLNLKL